MVVIWNISGQGYRSKGLCTPGGARVLLMDGTSVESAFALLLTKVTKHNRHIWRFKMNERRFIEEDD